MLQPKVGVGFGSNFIIPPFFQLLIHNIQVTSDIYSHIMKKADEESANTISKILG